MSPHHDTDTAIPTAIVKKIRRALISVSDKSNLQALAACLHARGIALISTGGTAQYLIDLGYEVTQVSEITHFPEMLDGRVKTLHPAIHGGLLADRENADHMQALAMHDIAAIDLLVVNLYPFEATRLKTDDPQTLIEQIDIGGPAMIRAAAKNHHSIGVVTDIDDYDWVIESINKTGNLSLQMRQKLAAKAYARTASYDASVAGYLAASLADETNGFPDYLLDSKRAQILPYGENPHQKAALYQRHFSTHGVANAKLLSGKPLSYNNVSDGDHAARLVNYFDAPACVIVKHGNPCGAALGDHAAHAFLQALKSDPQSAFGGVIAFNKTLDMACVEAIDRLFIEVVIAPDITPDALARFTEKKPKLRVLKMRSGTSPLAYDALQIKNISGGYLLQTADNSPFSPNNFETVTQQKPSQTALTDMGFAFEVVRAVSSNAIVIVKNGMVIGVGAGQMSRVDAVRIAIEHAVRHGHDLANSVLASDAFFPFADNIELAAKAGISAIIQPGGSIRDNEVIAAANAQNIAMCITKTRHFRH
jgi:phosphoribosylaminoimidazolecarboxamide formyltransferase/IMP cyclohydrolase